MGLADQPAKNLIQSLVKSTAPDRERLADVILMTALADAFISDDEFERIKDAMQAYVELDGLTSTWVYKRASELREDAPLFSGPRDQLVRELGDPELRRLSLSMAAKIICGGDRELQEEELVVLYSIAEAFRIPEDERNALIASWTPPTFIGDTNVYNRCKFNAPDQPKPGSFFDAMAQSPNDLEFRMLVHKVSAVRNLLSRSFEGAELHAFGEVLRIGPYSLGIDALFAHNLDLYISRFLGPSEALHPLEHSLFRTLLLRLDSTVKILIVHAEDLSSSDRVFLASVDPLKIRGERLEI